MSVRFASADTAVVRITGDDAAAFLQGQCTADLRGVALTDALWLNRKGRVLAHTVVAKETDGSFLLLSPHPRRHIDPKRRFRPSRRHHPR